MYKIKVCGVIFLILVLSILCAVRLVKLNYQKNHKKHLIELNNSINNLANEIKKCKFLYLKPKEKLFSKDYDLKKFVEDFSKKTNIKNVLMKLKNDIKEIKILADQEKEIYSFIESLLFELPGAVEFESIKIYKNKGAYSAILQFRMLLFNEFTNLIFINSFNKKSETIDLFEINKAKSHRLLCILLKSKAYINNFWFKIGDIIDNYKLTNIGYNFIEIQNNTSKKVIKLGSSW